MRFSLNEVTVEIVIHFIIQAKETLFCQIKISYYCPYYIYNMHFEKGKVYNCYNVIVLDKSEAYLFFLCWKFHHDKVHDVLFPLYTYLTTSMNFTIPVFGYRWTIFWFTLFKFVSNLILNQRHTNCDIKFEWHFENVGPPQLICMDADFT